MELNAFPHDTKKIVHGLEKVHAKCYGDKQTMAKLMMVLTNVLRHKEGACCW